MDLKGKCQAGLLPSVCTGNTLQAVCLESSREWIPGWGVHTHSRFTRTRIVWRKHWSHNNSWGCLLHPLSHFRCILAGPVQNQLLSTRGAVLAQPCSAAAFLCVWCFLLRHVTDKYRFCICATSLNVRHLLVWLSYYFRLIFHQCKNIVGLHCPWIDSCQWGRKSKALCCFLNWTHQWF